MWKSALEIPLPPTGPISRIWAGGLPCLRKGSCHSSVDNRRAGKSDSVEQGLYMLHPVGVSVNGPALLPSMERTTP